MRIEQGAASGRAPRMPFDAQVMIQSEDQAQVVNALAGNLSLTGMFIRTQQPRPAGSFLQFKLSLDDDRALVQGIGQVAWVRFDDEPPLRPAGMGIRFRWIDEDSKDTLLRIAAPNGRLGPPLLDGD